jgi:hypothetical protein
MSMSSSSSDRSVLYNNAGVQILLANQEFGAHRVIALELFRGALESKLAFERHQAATQQDPAAVVISHHDNHNHHAMIVVPDNVDEDEIGMVVPEEHQRCVTPELTECISQAEMHLQNLESYLTPVVMMEQQEPILQRDEAVMADRWVSHVPDSTMGDTITVPAQNRGYDPYIYRIPFQIPEEPLLVSTQVISSIVVYNLGLVHQLVSRESSKAAAFFEISAALLASLPESRETLLLRMALLNNFGVWCFENGDGESMRTCMEHLSVALQDAMQDQTLAIDESVVQGIRSNIQGLLTPLHGGSPAA